MLLVWPLARCCWCARVWCVVCGLLLTAAASSVEDALDRRCGATLQFENPDFLPVSYAFEAIPCSGRRVASFVVPTGAPSGDAHITW
ncbi:hypothetical protein VDGL01_12697 [Verticillium dahliae]